MKQEQGQSHAQARRPAPGRPPIAAALAATAALGLGLVATAAQAESRLERGRYLVESIAGCGNCHTPQGPNGPLLGQALAGGLVIEDPMFSAVSANITPDPDTGIGRWSDAQIARAIREGRRPDGSLIGPPMPFDLYRDIADSDVAAIVAYLRAVPPVKNRVAKSVYRMPLPPTWGPPVGRVAEVSSADPVAWGRYLAGPLGHCIECHSRPGPQGGPDFAGGLGAGGYVFTGPWGRSVAPNITPTNLKRYSDAQLAAIITTGVRPDGSCLRPPMAVSYYAKMKPADVSALVAYLRTLPPR
ncbi:MAG: cytochrome c [Burkholderiales bacterium]|nr:cytochrome c [Burkholderiales bacterium]